MTVPSSPGLLLSSRGGVPGDRGEGALDLFGRLSTLMPFKIVYHVH